MWETAILRFVSSDSGFRRTGFARGLPFLAIDILNRVSGESLRPLYFSDMSNRVSAETTWPFWAMHMRASVSGEWRW